MSSQSNSMQCHGASGQPNASRSEVLTSVKESLKKVMDKRGNFLLSEIFIHKFPSSTFKLQKGKLSDNSKNLYNFLLLVSTCAKTKNNNKNRNQKKSSTGSCPLVSGAKTDMELSKVHIGNLQCSETWEIFSVKSNDVLKQVVLDLVPDEQHGTERAFIVNTEEAKRILQGLDIHFLLNVLQNALLGLRLSDEEAQVVQALRICRNHFIHSEHVPHVDKLKQAARVLQEALTELSQPSQEEEIANEINALLKRLDAHNLIEELQLELIENAPQQPLLQRDFAFPSGNEGSLRDVCKEVCQRTEVRLRGEVWSGRTGVLLSLYQLWAQRDGALARYHVLIPLVQRPHLAGTQPCGPSDSAFSSPQDLVLYHLHQWTPRVLRDYGEKAVMSALRDVLSSTLALCDSALGYSLWPCWTECPRVVTDWPRSEGDGRLAGPHTWVQLLPLKPDQVKETVKSWHQQPSTQYVLYQQLQDSDLLTCPQILNIFREVTSKVVRNLDLELMRAVVDDAHAWTGSPDPAADMEHFFKVAFENILSDKKNVSSKRHCVPAYLVGPRNGPYKFRSLGLEEYCAAMFVSRNPSSAAWKWLRHPVRFQRVFTFVLQIWNEEGTLQEHETAIVNYLSVILGLYRLQGRNRAITSQQWQADRPRDWTLEDEGFVREANPKCKLWLFVFHVLESVTGELWAVELLLRHLLLYNVWIVDTERFSGGACDDFNRLCRKMANFLLRSNGNGLRLPTVKVSDRCSDELLQRREALLSSLASLKDFTPPAVVQVQQYYNSRESKYGREPLKDVLLKGSSVLLDSPVALSAYVGPLMLPGSCGKTPAQLALRELRLTLYELHTLNLLLQSCLPCLRLLSLNVDMASNDTSASPTPPPPPAESKLHPACYVRLGLRYGGSLQMLQQFTALHQIAVLRLHGLYLPSGGSGGLTPRLGGRLRVRCLVVKFVHGCGDPSQAGGWCGGLLSTLCQSCSGLERVIVARPPKTWGLPSIQDQVLRDAASLRRLVVYGSAAAGLLEAWQCLLNCPPQARGRLGAGGAPVNDEDLTASVYHLKVSNPGEISPENPDAKEVLGVRQGFRMKNYDVTDSNSSDTNSVEISPEKQTTKEADFFLQPRLPEEDRAKLCMDKPSGFELIIAGVPDDMRFALPWEERSPAGGDAKDNRVSIGPLSCLALAAYYSPLVFFCYEAGRGRAQVLRSQTRDLRLHLSLPALHDQTVARLASPEGGPLLRLLATPQYLRLECGALTAGGLLQLVSCVDEAKESLSKDSVAPYHLTVLARHRAPIRQELECQRKQLHEALPRLTSLNYALYAVQDSTGRALLTVRKSHQGRVFSELSNSPPSNPCSSEVLWPVVVAAGGGL